MKQGAEAAQRGESQIEADFCHRSTGDRQQLLGTFQPEPGEIGLGRFAEALPKRAQEVPGRQVGFQAQLGQGQLFLQAVPDEIADLAELSHRA